MSQPAKFKELLDRDEILMIPAAFNALSAKLVEEAKFDAVILGGQVLTVSLKALPDYGYLNLTDMVASCRAVRSATNLSIFVDADTGYGNAVNVIHTIRELEAAGAAGLFIEDQQAPPRCGNVAGRELISTEEMIGKIRAAADARTDPDLVICARTDARGVYGPDEAILRANAYAEAGADMTFVDGALSVEELRRFAEEVESRYKLVNLGGAAKHRTTPRPPIAELQEMGYDAVLFALNCMRASVKGLWDYLVDLRERDSAADVDFIDSLVGYPFESWYDYTGYGETRRQEEAYLPAEEVERRYAIAQSGYYVPGS
jgi:2-methylisocitrate lyase-like PEP mutase family enzyme